MKGALLILSAASLAACAAHLPPPLPPAPPPVVSSVAAVTVPLGSRATLNGIDIRPLAVVEDSRCPINARCVWAGRLILAVEIEQRGRSETLRTNMTLGQPLATTAGALTLVGAAPPKVAGSANAPPSLFTFELRS